MRHFSQTINFQRDVQSISVSFSHSFVMQFHVFLVLVFALICFHVFNGKLSKNGSQNSRRSTLLAPFSRPFPKIDFLIHFGRPLAHFWHPLASKWLPLGSRWLPFGSLLALFGSLLHPFGSLWLAFGIIFAEFS